MIRLFDESLMSNRGKTTFLHRIFNHTVYPAGNDEFSNLLISQETELKLLYRWKGLVEGMIPPSGTRGRRLCFAGSKNRRDIAHTQYTTRQLEYIGLVLHNMLKVKQHILHVRKLLLLMLRFSFTIEPQVLMQSILYPNSHFNQVVFHCVLLSAEKIKVYPLVFKPTLQCSASLLAFRNDW